jgi:hypothetical protein
MSHESSRSVRWTLVGTAVAVVVGASAFAALQSSDGASPSSVSPSRAMGPGEPGVRGCRDRVEGRFLEPDPTTDTKIGPITFTGLPASYRDYASRRDSELEPYPGLGMPAMKIITLVRSGARVALKVPRKQRRWLRLVYLRPIRRGTHEATLQACRRLPTRRARRRECGWRSELEGAQWACKSRYTQFNGGFGLDFAAAPSRGECAELIVRVGGRSLRKRLFRPVKDRC